MHEERKRDGIPSREEQCLALGNELVFNRLGNVTAGIFNADDIVGIIHASEQGRGQYVGAGTWGVVVKHHRKLGLSRDRDVMLDKLALARLDKKRRDDERKVGSDRFRRLGKPN